ncbi:uncharacterized protein PRCAT00000092001 [Priceomyces carsonii]|uniref:uncharacterized protein n=1 Tax=Priceomyces carsonii TaxID=28549 RepID=UPI002ED98FE2|nr:unnamed protein product [Priceomyces carsonii]
MINYSALRIASLCFKKNARRYYSDFLKSLPRVPDAGSRITNKNKAVDSNVEISSGPKTSLKTNRFAKKYSQNGMKSFKSKTIGDIGAQRDNLRKSEKEKDTNIKRHNQYLQVKERLRQKEKTLPNSNSRFNPKRNQASATKKESLKKDRPRIDIRIPSFISVSNLATIMHVPLAEAFKKLDDLGFEHIRHNYILDKENASLIAEEFNFNVVTIDEGNEDDLFPEPIKPDLLKERPPVVAIMGHVDHGKTTILDNLRKSSIVEKEFGGITQHIGAFSVITPISKKKITFLDTPGHAAFLKMRERGAIITDIIILVVAADDSVMPQTIEAIKHAKRSGVPLIVAINKCDKSGINVDKVLADLSRHGIDIEDYGGEVQTVRVSGKTGLNMDKLEEAVITLSELEDFKAEFSGVQSEGWVIESQVEKGTGNAATVLVRRGTVKVGDFLVAGKTYCKVRGMKDENGKLIKSCGPSIAAQIWGWKELPESGDQILLAKNEKTARKVVEHRITNHRSIQATRDIENINQKTQEIIEESKRQEKLNELKMAGIETKSLEDESEKNETEQVNYMIKADVFGSAEAIKESIDGLDFDEVKSHVVSHSTGPPSESDIDLAKALDALILCFNIKTPLQILKKADKEGVTVKSHNVIYHLIEDVTNELSSHLKPIIETKVLGEVQIKDIFYISAKNKSKIKIAGCKVASGIIKRSSKVKVIRGEEVIYTGILSSLKHVKTDISEANKGSECGLSLENWDKFESGDKIEVFEEISHPRYL